MMFRTTYAAVAFAALIASPLGCGTASENSGSAATAAQTPAAAAGTPAPTGSGGTPTPMGSSGTPAATGSSGTPTPMSSSGAPVSTAGAQPSLPSGEMASPITRSIDPVGVWWTEVETVGSEVLPILDKLTGTKIRFVMRVEVSATAPNHTVTFKFCQLQTEWTDPMDSSNVTTIGFRPDTVAAFSESAKVDLGGLSPGAKVPLPSLTFRGGTDESGKEKDEDGDGNPAVTAWVRTLLGIEIEVYETIAIRASLDLTVPDDDTLMGTLDFGADAVIVTSNNPIIADGTAVTITPDSKTVPITVKRLPGGGDCGTLPSTIKFTAVPPPPPPLFPPSEPAP